MRTRNRRMCEAATTRNRTTEFMGCKCSVIGVVAVEPLAAAATGGLDGWLVEGEGGGGGGGDCGNGVKGGGRRGGLGWREEREWWWWGWEWRLGLG